MDWTSLLTAQHLSIAQTSFCTVFKTHECFGERVTGTLIWHLHVTVVLVASITNIEILLHWLQAALLPAGCFYPPSCFVRPECLVQQHRSESAFTRAARCTELRNSRRFLNTTDLKRYVALSELLQTALHSECWAVQLRWTSAWMVATRWRLCRHLSRRYIWSRDHFFLLGCCLKTRPAWLAAAHSAVLKPFLTTCLDM